MRASFKPEVHLTVVWEKFRALAEGARIASGRLWGQDRAPEPAPAPVSGPTAPAWSR